MRRHENTQSSFIVANFREEGRRMGLGVDRAFNYM